MPTRSDPHHDVRLARTVVILLGPPLPGRAALARALEQRIPGVVHLRAPAGEIPTGRVRRVLDEGRIPLVEGDFARAAERAEAERALGELEAQGLYVAYMVDPHRARQEIYRRYARLPTRYADRWWALWEADLQRREPIGSELPESCLIAAAAGGSLLDQVLRVADALGVAAAEPPRGAQVRRVLVVDDDADTVELLADTLRALGCEVYTATDAGHGLAIATEEALDLVITDQQMPGLTGTQLAAEVAQRRPDVHIAVLTGYAEETVDAALETSSVELLLAKPAAGADLVRLLDELGERG